MGKGSGSYVSSDNFLFENCAHLQDKVESLIPQVLEAQGIGNKANFVNIKSGLFGTKNRCLVITGDKTFEVVVSCFSVGKYLYLSMYLNMKSGLMALIAGKTSESDIFVQQQRDGAFLAIKDCCLKACKHAGIDLNTAL